ncbi:hypothetical protein [Arcanobacterium pinnipediorum]|nr:hypothetical protein [Arcanobacterium pinnipediorum]
MGIVRYQGESRDGKTFVNVCYSPLAQELIRELLAETGAVVGN